MPPNKYIFLLAMVISAAGITVWLGSLIVAMPQYSSFGLVGAVPITLVAFAILRVIAKRITSKKDEH